LKGQACIRGPVPLRACAMGFFVDGNARQSVATFCMVVFCGVPLIFHEMRRPNWIGQVQPAE